MPCLAVMPAASVDVQMDLLSTAAGERQSLFSRIGLPAVCLMQHNWSHVVGPASCRREPEQCNAVDRAVVPLSAGNILWDCITVLDQATIEVSPHQTASP